MWIIARLLFALLLGLGRAIFGRQTSVDQRVGIGEEAWVLRQPTDKKGKRVLSTSYGVPCDNKAFLELTPEHSVDRLAKQLGFARELQTGDETFDRAVYVACDHPALGPILEADAQARDAVRELFRQGVDKIYTDGDHLWAKRGGAYLPGARELEALRALRAALALLPKEEWQALRDPFFWRAFAAEALAWGVAGYGLSGIVEQITSAPLVYFQWAGVIAAGLGVGAGMLVATTLVLRVITGRSSRGHRILVECVALLAIGLGWMGIETVSTANTRLDKSAPMELRPVVTETYTRTHRRRKGGTRTSYHLRLDMRGDARAAALVPYTLRVPQGMYRQARSGSVVEIRMRDGALGFPWVESMTLASATTETRVERTSNKR